MAKKGSNPVREFIDAVNSPEDMPKKGSDPLREFIKGTPAFNKSERLAEEGVDSPEEDMTEEDIFKTFQHNCSTQYTKIINAFTECGIHVAVYDSVKTDDGFVVYQVNPLGTLNNRVILKLYYNGEQIGICTGELSDIEAREVYPQERIGRDENVKAAIAKTKADLMLELALPENAKRKAQYEKTPVVERTLDIHSFIIYWISIDSNHMGKKLGILLLHLMMLNVCLRIDHTYLLKSFHLEDESDRVGGASSLNMYDQSLFKQFLGKKGNDPERFLLLETLEQNLTSKIDGIDTLSVRINSYVGGLIKKTRELAADNVAPLPAVLSVVDSTVGVIEPEFTPPPNIEQLVSNQRRQTARQLKPLHSTLNETALARGTSKLKSRAATGAAGGGGQRTRKRRRTRRLKN
jgi:hypothetical protein